MAEEIVYCMDFRVFLQALHWPLVAFRSRQSRPLRDCDAYCLPKVPQSYEHKCRSEEYKQDSSLGFPHVSLWVTLKTAFNVSAECKISSFYYLLDVACAPGCRTQLMVDCDRTQRSSIKLTCLSFLFRLQSGSTLLPEVQSIRWKLQRELQILLKTKRNCAEFPAKYLSRSNVMLTQVLQVISCATAACIRTKMNTTTLTNTQNYQPPHNVKWCVLIPLTMFYCFYL